VVSGGHTRAQFLGTGAAALSGAALASAWRAGDSEAAASDAAAKAAHADEGAFHPSFEGEHFALEIDGVPAGFVHNVSGGAAVGDVVTEKLGPDNIQKKHIGGVKYSDITVQVGMAQAKGMYNWIKASFDRAAVAKSGVIKACDADFRVRSVGSFQNALISEITFPACDGAAKDPAYMTVKFSPEATSFAEGSGNVSSAGAKPPDVGFKLEIDGVSSKRVSKIDAFTVKQDFAGGTKDPVLLEIPDLSVALSEGSGLSSWIKYYESFLIKGNFSDGDELTGLISYTRNNAAIATLDLRHVGIFKMTPEKVESNSESIRRIKAEMYCEDIRFNLA
jgi:hypothetical protein